jgi:hypothetical protein
MSTQEVDKTLSFEENEKVLCYHGPLIYEAKVRINAIKESKHLFLNLDSR